MYTIWIGGIEVDHQIETLNEAMKIVDYWRIDKGYDDVHIEKVGY